MGPSEEFIIRNDLVRPVEGGEIFQSFEEKPSILFRINRRIPLSTSTFMDPLVQEYLHETQVPEPAYTYAHSVCDEEAYLKSLSGYFRRKPEIPYDQWFGPMLKAEEWLHRSLAPVVSGTRVANVRRVFENMNWEGSPGILARTFYKTKEEFQASFDGDDFVSGLSRTLHIPGSPRTYWAAHLKDEIRLTEKVTQKKTRLFLCAPYEHHFHMCRYSLDFNEKLITNARNFNNPVAVGSDLWNGGFAILGERLAEKLFQIFSDANKYDASIWNSLMQMMCWLRFNMLHVHDRTYENFVALCNLYRDSIKTPVVLFNGFIVYVFGQPTGFYNTAIDNSGILSWIFFFSFCEQPEARTITYDEFNKNVFLRTFGDDSALAHSYPWWTQKRVAQSFRKLGIEIEFAEHWEFLGHFIVWSDELDCYTPVFPYHRMLGSLLYNGEMNQEGLIQKAFALRNLTFTNPSAFAIVDAYCLWLLDRYPEYSSQYHSPQVLSNLICGRKQINGFPGYKRYVTTDSFQRLGKTLQGGEKESVKRSSQVQKISRTWVQFLFGSEEENNQD